jgi:hypothetical protein
VFSNLLELLPIILHIYWYLSIPIHLLSAIFAPHSVFCLLPSAMLLSFCNLWPFPPLQSNV